MTLKTKLSKGVDRAFAKIDSLLKPAAFVNKVASGFNFDENKPMFTTTIFSTRGFMESKTKKVDGAVVTTTTLMMKTNASLALSLYSTVTVEGVEYHFTVIQLDDFITKLELVRV